MRSATVLHDEPSTEAMQGELGLFSNPQILLAIIVSGMLQVSVAVFPFTQRVFDVPAHTAGEWTVNVLLAIPVTLIEMGKLSRRRLRPASAD